MTLNENNKYTEMQRKRYDFLAKTGWEMDRVVGSWAKQNSWNQYETLFVGMQTGGKVALDFGCGPGRNIEKYRNKFSRIDGIDISEINIKNATDFIDTHGITDSKLYVCNGVDLREIPDNTYDIVFSTICLQHICVYDIRRNYFEEFFRVLKPGGWMTHQMGFGTPTGTIKIEILEYDNSVTKRTKPENKINYTVDYYDNFYDATDTNGLMDVRVEKWEYLEKDLTEIGFEELSYTLTEPGFRPGGSLHPNFIFFKGKKV